MSSVKIELSDALGFMSLRELHAEVRRIVRQHEQAVRASIAAEIAALSTIPGKWAYLTRSEEVAHEAGAESLRSAAVAVAEGKAP